MSRQEPKWVSMETPEAVERKMDALHILPLSRVPLEKASLRELKMVKNHQLESVIETFTVRRTRSAQVDIVNLPQYFGWSEDDPHPDLPLLRRVGALPSFDIYSLRRLLRDLDFAVDEFAELKLPADAAAQLGEYMTTFTRPLISRIYGDQAKEIDSTKGLFALFKDPNHAKVRRRLTVMATEINLKIEAVPRFLENFGDTLMSIAFLRNCFDELAPITADFLATMDTVRSNELQSKDEDLMEICTSVENDVNELTASIAGRFKAIEQLSTDIWEDHSAHAFRDVERAIVGHHEFIGSALCGLTVKMKVWDLMFPDKTNTNPAQMADFIKYHMKQGLETMQTVRVSAHSG